MITRRKFLKGLAMLMPAGLTLSGALAFPRLAWAEWSKEAFSSTDFNLALRTVAGTDQHIPRDEIEIFIADTIQNGALAPIGITTTLTEVSNIIIMVEANPKPLAANFKLSPAVTPEIDTRIKVAMDTSVHVFVKTSAGLFSAKRDVKVVEGGCN